MRGRGGQADKEEEDGKRGRKSEGGGAGREGGGWTRQRGKSPQKETPAGVCGWGGVESGSRQEMHTNLILCRMIYTGSGIKTVYYNYTLTSHHIIHISYIHQYNQY